MQVQIDQQAKYHTIVVMRTSLQPLARQFPHTIFTKNDIIDNTPQKEEQSYDYNIEIDAAKYMIHKHYIILADFTKISCIFKHLKNNSISTEQGIKYSQLQQKHLHFYLYLNSKDFVEVLPLAVIKNTLLLVFPIQKQRLIDNQQHFKDLTSLNWEKNCLQDNYYHYSSQFGLLSDFHFMNSLVRGYRQFSCYRRYKGKYYHLIDPEVYTLVIDYYPPPGL